MKPYLFFRRTKLLGSISNRGYSIFINAMVPAEYIDAQIERSQIRELKLIRRNFRKNRTIDAITGGHSEAIEKVELILQSKDMPIKQMIRQWLQRRDRRATDLIEIAGDIAGIGFEEVKIELDDNGTRRTLVVASGKTSEYRIDLGDQVPIETASGLPNFDALLSFALTAVEQLRNTINRGDNELDQDEAGAEGTERVTGYAQ